MAAQVVALRDVRCLGRGVPYCRALLCRIRGKDVTVSLDDLHETSEVRQPGDYGTLIVPLWVAYGLGVVDLQPSKVA